MFWRGFGDEGNVLLSEKIHIQSKCTKDFLKFPFDKQFCVIKFGSCKCFRIHLSDKYRNFCLQIDIL